MTAHSPEPWIRRALPLRTRNPPYEGSESPWYSVYRPDGHTVAKVFGRSDSPDDARRIVACVNACRGIPTELLEKANWAMIGQCALVHSGAMTDEDRHRLENIKPGEIACVSPGAIVRIDNHNVNGRTITTDPTLDPL